MCQNETYNESGTQPEKPVKIFLTGMHSSRKHELMWYLQKSVPQYLMPGRLTTWDPSRALDESYRYFTKDEIEEIFENRSFVFLHDGTGLIKNDLEENSLFTLSIEDFLLVPNKVYNVNNILVVWIDTDRSERQANWSDPLGTRSFDETEERQMQLMRQFQDSLESRKVMYFRRESHIEILARIIQYIECDDQKKKIKFLDAEFSR